MSKNEYARGTFLARGNSTVEVVLASGQRVTAKDPHKVAGAGQSKNSLNLYQNSAGEWYIV